MSKNRFLPSNQTPTERIETVCLKFVKKGLKLDQFKAMFPVRKPKHKMEKEDRKVFCEQC